MLDCIEKICNIMDEWEKVKVDYDPDEGYFDKLHKIYFNSEEFQKEVRPLLKSLSELENLLDTEFIDVLRNSTYKLIENALLDIKEYRINGNLKKECIFIFLHARRLRRFLKCEVIKYQYYNEVNEICQNKNFMNS